MSDKTKQLEKLIELHSKVVERLDSTDDTLLEGPLYKGLVDERIRLRTLAAGISLDISLLETQIAADKETQGQYPYGKSEPEVEQSNNGMDFDVYTHRTSW